MGKRHREDTDDDILKKLAEIQQQLNKRRRKSSPPPRRRRVRCISSDDETDKITNNAHVTTATSGADAESGSQRLVTGVTAQAVPAAELSTSSGNSTVAQQAQNSPTVLPEVAGPSSMNQTEQPEEELDDDILQLLGDAPKTETQLGPNVHKDIASRWKEILSKGLPKETKDKVLKDHLIPANCEALVPPLLNAELKAGLPESLIKRDGFLAERQRQIGIALAALANATHMVIKKDSHSKILKAMSDAGRILCDVHFNETKSRRSFIISGINANLKEALMDTKSDKYLFGENVSDTVKSAKSIQKLGADLKRKGTNPKFNKSNFYKKQSLNTRALQRKMGGKPDVGRPRPPVAAAVTMTTTRGAPRPGTSSQRTRSPPPPPLPRKSNRRY